MKDNKSFHREELDKLSSEQLDKILRDELDADCPDVETVLSTLNTLEEREPTDSTNCPDRVMRDWEELQGKYRGSLEHSTDSQKKRTTPKKWLGAIAAAVAIALVLAMTIPQTVGAESIFDILGRWTKDLFNFSDSKGEQRSQETPAFQTENEGLQQLYDAVVEQGITVPVVPTWLPEGYELKELKVLSQSKIPKVYARFTLQDKYIQIMIECHSEAATNKYPKDDVSVEICEYDGISYHIFTNEDTRKVIWTNENAECAIITNDTSDLVKQVLNSI